MVGAKGSCGGSNVQPEPLQFATLIEPSRLASWLNPHAKVPCSIDQVTITAADRTAARALEGFDTLSRFGDWTTTKNDAQITLYSGTSNLAVRCSDATMTYLAFIRISDPRSIIGLPEIKPPPYFDFTAWAVSNEPTEFTFLVSNASDAYATGIVVLNPKFADQITKFWAQQLSQ